MRKIQKALTFDDVLLVPAFSKILPHEVNVSTSLTRTIQLHTPLLSAAMDTVTDAPLAIALAQEGGLGIIHKNITVEQQALAVAKVKRHESGMVKDPITICPTMPIREVIALTQQHKISGLPIVDQSKLVGIVTNRDLRFEPRLDQPVSAIMTPQSRLITVQEGASIEQARTLMHQHRLERVLVVNEAFELKGLITVKDILKTSKYPLASKDMYGRLRVGAAVGVGNDIEQRVAALAQAGVDVIVIDTAHGHSQRVLERIEWMKRSYPHIELIGGNIATADAALALLKAGVDGVKVGIGPGSICTTRVVSGVGIPQLTAIMQVASALKGTDIPLIADGGIRYSGDLAKALAAGAHTIMIGSLFAGTDEAPGEIELYQGRSYKSYRGMGSLGAMQEGSKDRYFQDNISSTDKLVPEGIEGRVPYKGPITNIIHQLIGGLRASMGYLGCINIQDMHDKAEFVEITPSGARESHVHDVQITKEAPNYHANS